MMRYILLLLFVVTVCWKSALANSEFEDESEYEVEKVTFKSTYVQHDEKVARVRISADTEQMKETAQREPMLISSNDILTVQALIKDKKTDKSSIIEQVMLRFENLRSGKDNIYILRKLGNEYKIEINLKKEIKSDKSFWAGENLDGQIGEDKYKIELIFGDKYLKQNKGFSWIITEQMKWLDNNEADAFKPLVRGVFDFDISIKKDILLPEFEFPLPKHQIQAKWFKVLAALLCIVLPLPLLFFTWFRMNVFPLNLPTKNGKHFITVIGLHACIAGHMISLVMFWIKWNIVTTWKVTGIIMIPTLIFMRAFLQLDDIDHEGEEMNKMKQKR